MPVLEIGGWDGRIPHPDHDKGNNMKYIIAFMMMMATPVIAEQTPQIEGACMAAMVHANEMRMLDDQDLVNRINIYRQHVIDKYKPISMEVEKQFQSDLKGWREMTMKGINNKPSLMLAINKCVKDMT